MARKSSGAWFRKGTDSWYATVEGKKISLGVKGEENSKDAEKAWHRVMADGVEARDTRKPEPKPVTEPKPVAETTPKEDGKTVQGLVDEFLANAEMRLKEGTVSRYRFDLKVLAKAHGKLSAERLTGQMLTKWISGLKVSNTSRAIALRSVSACFGWAVKNDMLLLNPVKKAERPRANSRSAEAVISEADHKRLMEKATKQFRLVLRVLWETGCRPGEVGRITVENFNPENGVAVIHEHKTDHTGRPRVICFPADLCEEMKGLVEKVKAGALFKSKSGKAWSGRSITEAMKNLKKKTGQKTIAYGYRHSFATTALSNGVPDSHVAALLGHSSTAMLHKHYSHLTSQSKVLLESLARVRK